MIEVTFTTFCKVLKKSFTNTKTVKSMSDFNLYALALFHGQVNIVSVKNI